MILTLLWLIPLVGALGLLALPSQIRFAAALTCALATTGVGIAAWVKFDPATSGQQLVERHRWIPSLGASYLVGVDGVALSLVALTVFLTPLLIVALAHNDSRAAGLILIVESMSLMCFLSLDVLLFYVFFEAMLIPMYLLIAGTGSGSETRSAAMKFLLYNLAGGLLMLGAVVGIFVYERTFDWSDLRSGLDLDPATENLLFVGFMVAFAVKAPLWPLHTWLPGAVSAAPAPAAVLMMAIVDKVGTFGMLRYCLTLFPHASHDFAPVIIAAAVVSIVYGACMAIAQTDIIRLISYASISHFGFIVLGVFANTQQSVAGASLYMVTHGLATAAFFLVAAIFVARRQSTSIGDFGGESATAPVLSACLLLGGLATLALPGLASFVSEFLVLVGSYLTFPVAAIAAASGLVLAAIYVLWAIQRMCTGPRKGPRHRDASLRELAVLVPILVAVVALGVYPRPILDVLDGAQHPWVSGLPGTAPVVLPR